ncbi:MAG: peptidylprolyl isomerase [Planctomycetota bacterium]
MATRFAVPFVCLLVAFQAFSLIVIDACVAQDATAASSDGMRNELAAASDASMRDQIGDADESKPIKDDEALIEQVLGDMPPEIASQARAARTTFQATKTKLAKAMAELRRIQVRFFNRVDRTPAAKETYRQQRNEIGVLLRQHFDEALELYRMLPSSEAASFLLTMVQHQFDRDEYSATTYEAATRLIDSGQNFTYLFLAAARSAAVVGRFENVRKIYDVVDDEQLKDTDRRILAGLDVLEAAYKREQQLIDATDSEKLPQVRFTTTQGNFVVELFSDSAPSAVSHFLKLVGDGFYDGMDFSQVLDGLLALTGDSSGDGRGNVGRFLIDEHENENARTAQRGSILMAKMPIGPGEFIPNSASSQIAIAFLPLAGAGETQTILGRVIEGMHVVSSLRRVDPTKKAEKKVQLPPDVVISIEVVRTGPELPEPEYVDLAAEIEKARKAGILPGMGGLQNNVSSEDE